MNVNTTQIALATVLLLGALVPANAQLSAPQDDPLARIRGAAQANTQACSATGETLCEQVAPKIIANAQGDSPLAGNLRRLIADASARKAGRAAGAPAVAWAVAAFRDAGVEVHTEKYMIPAAGAGATPRQQENVIAEIRGREKPDEWVLLGARLDSLRPDTDVINNACNAAAVIEVARDIHLTAIRPRRSIRFVLFGGEGRTMAGSWAYTRAHRNELDRARAAILFSACGTRLTGFVLNGRRDIQSGVQDAVKPIESLGVAQYSLETPFETDSFDFIVEGVPTIRAAAPRDDIHHDILNSFEKVDVTELKRNTAIAAVAAFGIAERSTPIGPRQSRAEIEALLKSSGLGEQMKSKGLWRLWESGERGRQP